MTHYHYLTISEGRYGGYTVYGWDQYPSHSVLAGQSRKNFIENFPTLDQAQAAYPEASLSNQWVEPQPITTHLPNR